MHEAIETYHAAEREYAEQERRKRFALEFASAGPQAVEKWTHQARGEFLGFAVDAKPAIALGNQRVDVRALQEVLDRGGDYEIVDNVIVNPRLVEARVASEPELALWVGWDREQTVAENVRRATARTDADTESQALMAFILGFPESAIRGYIGSRKIEVLDESLVRERGSRDDLALFRAFHDSPQGSAEREAFGRQYGDDLRRIYRDIFHLGERAIDGYLVEHPVQISSPQGYPVYRFIAFGSPGEQASDIQELRERVRRAFAEAGFVENENEKEKTPPS